jgi:hypothetical protein
LGDAVRELTRQGRTTRNPLAHHAFFGFKALLCLKDSQLCDALTHLHMLV